MKLTGTTSRTKFDARLRELWAGDYIDRPELQRAIFAYKDKRPIVHALGQRGADWLTKNDGIRFPKGKGWKTANQLKSSEHFEHRLGVTETMLRFREDVAAAQGLRLIYADELWATSNPDARMKKPHRLPTEVTLADGTRRARATDPDYTFALGKHVNGVEKRALFFLEWDNSTEDFVKSNPMESALLQKHLAYADVHHRKLHRDLYGLSNFRVLFVVNGVNANERIEKMKHIFQRRIAKLCPAGVFQHTTMSDIEENQALSKIWHVADGRSVSLV
jgi:hypothetical protein